MFNIFFLVGFAILAAIILSVFVTRGSTPSKQTYLLPEEDASKDPQAPPLTLEDLGKLVHAFCREKKLSLKETIRNSETDVYWIAENKDPILFGTLVFGGIQVSSDSPLVPLASVLEFKDFVKGAGSTKGFLLTTGYFSRDVHQPLEGVKVTLMNRKTILEELKSRQPQS